MKAIKLFLVSFLVLCLSTTSVVASEKSDKNSVIDQTYPQAQAEVIETFLAIRQSIMDGAGLGKDTEYMDQLISFHAYGPKFTEFNDGELYDSAENEAHERTLFGETVDIGGVKTFWFQPGSLEVAVYYGNVANLTFISDFELIIDGTLYPVKNLITLLFVKTKGKWKMVHEHHSPAN
jgi:hypothetical protein